MKIFDLNSLGVHEMNALEMQETDGGIIGLILAAAALLLLTSSCGNSIGIQVGGQNNTINTRQSADSSMNGWTADSTKVVLDLKPLN